jgi:hypothetical protein
VVSGDVSGKVPIGRPRDLPVFAEQGRQARRQHHVAIFAAFALANAEDHAVAVDVLDA